MIVYSLHTYRQQMIMSKIALECFEYATINAKIVPCYYLHINTTYTTYYKINKNLLPITFHIHKTLV